MIESRTLATLIERAFVIILASQFERVIGLQFFMSPTSFPSFGSKVIMDSLWEGASIPVSKLYFQELRIIGPERSQNFLYTL